MYIYIYICVCMYMCECIYIYMCVCMYMCECIYIYVCVYVCICVNVYIYIYIYVCIYNTTFSIAYEHSSFFIFSQNIPVFFLNNPNFYKFCQLFLIQNISESANLRHTWFRQNFVHLLITSKPCFKISSPITISKLHSRGNSQNTCLPRQTQKTSVS